VDTTLFQLAIAFLEKHPNSVQQILKKEPEILKRDARIQKALDYLRDNYNKDISLEELLNVSCVGRAHFFRLFKKETGKTPFEYLSYYRLEKAKELLKKTNKTLEEISEIVGYKDVRCLQEIFYRFTGVSPKHFRSNK
jgi:transcriptional regulator GlxA family with amidase domain